MWYKVHRITLELLLNLIKPGSLGYRKYMVIKEYVNQHLSGIGSDEVRMWNFYKISVLGFSKKKNISIMKERKKAERLCLDFKRPHMESKMMQPLCQIIWQFVTKLNM